jgi:hypothetical protein
LKIKQRRIIMGLIVVVGILLYAINEWDSRQLFIEHELGSVYSVNFQSEFEMVKRELNLENKSLRLEDFEVDYVKDGKITDLSWQLLEQNGNSYNLFQIRYDMGKGKYQVMHSQLDTWLQYNRLIDADHFFKNLNELDILDITYAKGDFLSYVIQSTGERVNYAVKNRTNFIVSNAEIQLLDDEQLPVEGYYISTFAMQKTGEERNEQGNIALESFEGTESSTYLFDVNIGDK